MSFHLLTPVDTIKKSAVTRFAISFLNCILNVLIWGLSGGCNTEDPGSVPGSERSPEKGKGYPLQYSCLENGERREEPGGL